MKRWLALPLRVALVTLLMAVAAWFIPTPYILRAPGHADDLSGVVAVGGGHASSSGRLLMTTVIYEKANLLFCFYALFDGRAMLVPVDGREVLPLAGPHGPLPTAFMSQDDVMATSKDVARVVALRKRGYDVPVESTGVRVMGFLPGAAAEGVLRVGDVVDSVDGLRVRKAQQLRAALGTRKAREMVTVRYRRQGVEGEARVALAAHGGKAFLGIMAHDAYEHGKLPVDIDIVTHNVNGASAGLMFTLAIIDQLTPGGITKGHVIAGTGTISLDGTVGPIEGVDLKLSAAQRAGATVFLVPRENYSEVRGSVSQMKIVPVGSVDEALKALEAIP